MHRPRYRVELLNDDIAARGWLPIDLARRARVSSMTVYRFLRGERQTARTAQKLSKALGFDVTRYLISTTEAA
jgi:transcriptional regulator with XRE-family HTH domain